MRPGHGALGVEEGKLTMGFQGDPVIAVAVGLYVVILFAVGFYAVCRRVSAPNMAELSKPDHVPDQNVGHTPVIQPAGIDAPCGERVTYVHTDALSVFIALTQHTQDCLECSRLAFKPQPLRPVLSQKAPCGLPVQGNGVVPIETLVEQHRVRCFHCTQGITLEVQQTQLDRSRTDQ